MFNPRGYAMDVVDIYGGSLNDYCSQAVMVGGHEMA